MPDIKEKPKMDKPKLLDKKVRLPQETGRQLKEKLIQEMQRPGTEAESQPENAGEYATGRVEDTAKDGLGRGEDMLHNGVDRFRRQQAKAKIEKQRRQYTETGRAEQPPTEAAAPQPSAHEHTAAPHAERAVSTEPAHTGDIPEPQRKLWRERATQTQRERIRERGHIADKKELPGPASPTARNASQIETHFNIKEKKPTRTIRERGALSNVKAAENSRRSIKTASAVPKARGRSTSTLKRTAKRTEKRMRQKASKEAAKKSAQAVKTTGKAVRIAKAVASAVAKGVSVIIAAGGGVALLVVILFIGAVAAFAASPFGVFFAAEKSGPDTVSVAEAVATVNADFNAQLEALQGGEYDSITISGQPPSWPEVLAVFAAKTAAADEGTDVVTLDAQRVELLKAVFWDMTAITTEEETVDRPDSDPDDDIDDSGTARVLHITITAKTAEEMRSVYAFTDYQNKALTELLAERAALSSLVGDLYITNVDAKALLAALPDDLSPERRAVIEAACTLVGKVNYFWGGKSLVLGWDSRWGQIQKVWADGSKSTGTYRPYGLDCSGFVDWVFYQVSGGEYIIGHSGGAASQHGYCTSITWDEALPGDLVFYPGDEHVGIVGGRDENGNLLIIHCASGYNNVVITGIEGFTSIGRPVYFS